MVSTRRQTASELGSTGSQGAETQNQVVPSQSAPTADEGPSGGRKSPARGAAMSLRSTQTNTSPSATSDGVAKPAAKRRKNRKWSAAMKQSARLVQESKESLVRSFMQLPLDIVLEMFCHLHPRTLLATSRTSKELRAMVLSRRLAGVWSKSREGSGVPEPPAGFSEPRWASLLFDTRRCQVCWKYKNSEVNWYFLKRTCYNCLHRHTVCLPILGHSQWLAGRPDYGMLKSVDIEILEYIPRSVRFSNQNSIQQVTFWDEDVVAVVKVWQDLSGRTDIEGREAFQAWKLQRRETMRTNHNMMPTYHLWRINCLYPSKRMLKHKGKRSYEEERCRQLEEMKARLREAGHRPEDIELSKFLDPNNWYPRTTMSDSDHWVRLRPIIEPDIRQLRDFRIALEMELVTHGRLLVLEGVYQGFLHTLPPSVQYHCPPAGSLRTEREVAAILETPKNITVAPSHFQPVAAKMQTFIDQAQDRLKQNLRSAATLHSELLVQEPWLLARNVFGRCWQAIDGQPKIAKDRILVGWDMIATHSYKGHSKVWLRPGVPVPVPRSFELNERASKDSQRLIALAGMRDTATVEAMDERDPRFVCLGSRCTGMDEMEVLKVFTWRAALVHLRETDHGNWISIRMATQQEIEAAKRYEGVAREKVNAWSCNHCSRYLGASNADTKEAVLAHLANEHGLTDPQMQSDYFVNERCRHAYEVPYTIYREDVLGSTESLS